MRTLLTTALVASAMLLINGCKTAPSTDACACSPCNCSSPCPCASGKTSMGMMNDSCPMSGKKLNADSPTSSWNGETMGFCGNGCKSKFDSMDDQGKDDYVTKVKSSGN